MKWIIRFINWIKRLFKKQDKETPATEKLIPAETVVRVIKPRKQNFYDKIKNGESFFSKEENLCIKVSKFVYIEFIRRLNIPVVACYRRILTRWIKG